MKSAKPLARRTSAWRQTIPRCVQTEPRTSLTIQHVSTYSLTRRPLWLDVSDLCWESSILGGCPITDYSPQVPFWETSIGLTLSPHRVARPLQSSHLRPMTAFHRLPAACFRPSAS